MKKKFFLVSLAIIVMLTFTPITAINVSDSFIDKAFFCDFDYSIAEYLMSNVVFADESVTQTNNTVMLSWDSSVVFNITMPTSLTMAGGGTHLNIKPSGTVTASTNISAVEVTSVMHSTNPFCGGIIPIFDEMPHNPGSTFANLANVNYSANMGMGTIEFIIRVTTQNGFAQTSHFINVHHGYNFDAMRVPRSKGDVTSSWGHNIQDGFITGTDVQTVRAFILGVGTLSSMQQWSADIDGNGVINLHDVLRMERHVQGTQFVYP
jgi:hypothetical protein